MYPLLACHQDIQDVKNDRSSFAAINASISAFALSYAPSVALSKRLSQSVLNSTALSGSSLRAFLLP